MIADSVIYIWLVTIINYLRLMKTSILSTKDAELLEKLIATYGKVVTSRQIHKEATHIGGYQQTKNRIRRLSENGWLIRLKRGLYEIADLSSRGFPSLSPYVIANLLVETSYVSFEAALSHHGMFDQLPAQFISISLKQFREIELGSVCYRFIKTQKNHYTGWEQVAFDSLTAKIALAEKALVDLVHFRKSLYTVDLVIEKLQTQQERLNFSHIVDYLGEASQVTIKTFGLVFDLFGWDSARLYRLVRNRKSTHRIHSNDRTFNARWRLYYDAYLDKYGKQEGAA